MKQNFIVRNDNWSTLSSGARVGDECKVGDGCLFRLIYQAFDLFDFGLMFRELTFVGLF